MMTFVVATMIAHAAYYTLVSGWPSSENSYIDVPTAVVLIVLMYGGGAAVGGFAIGAISAGLARSGVIRTASQADG
ncbi:hypothetical protein [Rhodopirellula bahusiensis]|uniref:Uncharacterized protein n=1 Tax=Rhodopirellula bahusiensis TaxID=2014065 RepID=A0A2G1W9Z5_9BACT|nr:hypothetical protein [Rhodopirellula bahusiensis]PHQ35862.1 hypothetical protein CEE69_07755 [Rhodopirellula bahusiensis]